MYTPDELMVEMGRLGYRVTRRRLTDWVQKGLLPAPRPRGLGQGRGKVYRWVEPDVLHRALDVAELIRWHRRTSALFLPLWVLGYDVPLAEVQVGLRKVVDGLSAGVDAAIPIGGDRSDLVRDLLADAQAQLEMQPHRIPVPLAAPFLHAFLDSNPRDWSLLLEDLRAVLTSDQAEGPAWPEADRVTNAVAFIQDRLSVPRLETLVAASTEGDLAMVHRDLGAVMRSARAVAHLGMDIEPQLLIRILVFLGTRGAIVDLALRDGGLGSMVDQGVAQFVDGCHRMLTDPRLRTELQRLRAQSTADDASGEEYRSG